jgi:xanthine dehydrogenase molybdopterin-binding subunit B
MAGKSNSTGKKKASRAAAHRSAANGTKAAAAHWVGQPIRRKEESRLVSGRGIFVDDERMPGMLHIRFVRSSYAHAKITRVDVSKAEKFPGVVCTLTGAEIKKQVQPFIEIGPGGAQKIADYPMAVDKVVFQGEPLAAVAAETRLAAEDAAELVEVDYEPLPAVVTAEDALKAFLNTATSKKPFSRPPASCTSGDYTFIVFRARRSSATSSWRTGTRARATSSITATTLFLPLRRSFWHQRSACASTRFT